MRLQGVDCALRHTADCSRQDQGDFRSGSSGKAAFTCSSLCGCPSRLTSSMSEQTAVCVGISKTER